MQDWAPALTAPLNMEPFCPRENDATDVNAPATTWASASTTHATAVIRMARTAAHPSFGSIDRLNCNPRFVRPRTDLHAASSGVCCSVSSHPQSSSPVLRVKRGKRVFARPCAARHLHGGRRGVQPWSAALSCSPWLAASTVARPVAGSALDMGQRYSYVALLVS